MTARILHAALYGDIDLGLIDGSAVWLVTMSQLLASSGCRVTLLLKGRRDPSSPLLAPLSNAPSIRLVEQPTLAHGLALNARSRIEASVQRLRELDQADRFDLVVVRGMAVGASIASEPAFQGRLWTYLTDIPQSVADLDDVTRAEVDGIVRASRVMLCQTEELRSYLESIAGAAVGKTAILPPVVPAAPSDEQGLRTEPRTSQRLVYLGKFAPLWNTLEMTTLPDRLAARGVDAELIAIGDKIHAQQEDPTYQDRMRDALDGTPKVTWYGGRSRLEAMRLASTGDIALSWRDGSLDASLELSTKVLEYGLLGLPVVLNRTPMHERLLGRDYPLFVSSVDDVVEAVVDVSADPAIGQRAAERVRTAALDHTLDRARDRLMAILARTFPPPIRRVGTGRKLRIGIASHDFKFFTGIQRHLEALPDAELRVDVWPTLDEHDVAAGEAMVAWADVVICEWCGPNAIWYSARKRPDQRLIIRLHRFELDRRWPRAVAIDRVDRVVAVSDSYRTFIAQATGWPTEKIVTIPNWVDDVSLDRPKLPGARFNLGFIGMAPARKRLDRAFDVLERLRAVDTRYHLFVKTKLTWDYPWLWRRPDEREHIDLVMRRSQRSSLLRGAVIFDQFGPDVASWLRKIGFVLSTSDDESFHLAPAEGMASGSVPALLDWPGSETIYDPRWIHPSTDAMAASIAAMVDEDRWGNERAVAREQARSGFALSRVASDWVDLIRDLQGSGDRGAEGAS